ncbi:MAG: 4-hydroxy-tetrahydrodipicolinate reductase [Defluviitaleaceae bacterium]|nr:4-hydroxy-tetrahydrodipicolinate reductase [Defluviitaleaceae bacterium]
MIKIIMTGCFGRMGEVVCRLAAESPDMEIAAGIDCVPGSANFPVYTAIKQCTEPADAIICFLPPNAEDELLDTPAFCAENRIPLIFCSTGHSSKVDDAIAMAAKKAAVLRSGNMSLGINLLSSVLAKISPLLHASGFDIEITEKHHNQKIDAPSGTAFLLADSIREAILESNGGDVRYIHDRSNTHTKRERNEIGIHALRGGTIVGEHTVTFAGHNEIIELKHISHSREVFAVGALKAAKFLQGKPAGLYTMQDVIN